ncbi:MAG: hypothetical protein ACJ74G_20770 [Blastocatellia bacterium]
MSVYITYKLTGSGWAECLLAIDDQTIITTASYLSHALESLLQGIVDIMRGQAEARASFDEEPGEYRWLFLRKDEQTLNIRILWFDGLWGHKPDNKGHIIFDGDCRLRTFAEAVLSASQKVLAEHGLEGYKDQWHRDEFPETLQAELERLLREGRR